MDITPLIPSDRKVIKSYGDGKFTLTNGDSYGHSIIITPEGVEEWDIESFADITEAHFESLLARVNELDVVIIGTGKEFKTLLPKLQQSLRAKGLRTETMDTGAACRTYNVLLAEERRVAAALIAI
ncbi:MAG: hypothetical protein EB060_08185 [Proteobacteria bacterium]|nr:hypothetical protein [Pseudomonadota bacterium]